ncbi:GNAT family protein [Streptomyces monashensis]|uniref:GNAT family N-acetyltransferase n=1 Tax=Streptomyces monashensis TaxID=1678012 RepID=UPI0033C120A3
MSVAVVELREFTVADGSFLMSWIGGPAELMAWAGPTFTWPLDGPQIAAYAAECATPRRWGWMGFDPRTRRTVGHASVRIAADGSTGRLGRVLVALEARGRGVGGGMVREVLGAAFGPLGLQRVELGVFSHNTSALRLYERLGFQAERVLADVERVEGQSWSAVQMFLSRADWAAAALGGQRAAQQHEAEGTRPAGM